MRAWIVYLPDAISPCALSNRQSAIRHVRALSPFHHSHQIKQQRLPPNNAGQTTLSAFVLRVTADKPVSLLLSPHPRLRDKDPLCARHDYIRRKVAIVYKAAALGACCRISPNKKAKAKGYIVALDAMKEQKARSNNRGCTLPTLQSARQRHASSC